MLTLNGLGEEAGATPLGPISVREPSGSGTLPAKCNFMYQGYGTNPDGTQDTTTCAFSPMAAGRSLFLAPAAVPLGIVDGLLSSRPMSRWLVPGPDDKQVVRTTVQRLGLDADIIFVIGEWVVSAYLWYKIYSALTSKGGN